MDPIYSNQLIKDGRWDTIGKFGLIHNFYFLKSLPPARELLMRKTGLEEECSKRCGDRNNVSKMYKLLQDAITGRRIRIENYRRQRGKR